MYKINKGYVIQKIKGKTVFFNSEESLLYTLNEVASFIFWLIKRGMTEDEIIKAILNKYNINAETAETDLTQLINDLIKANIIVQA